MEQTLATLHNDHRNYSKLLSTLKNDIDKLLDSTNPDFIRLYDIMNYMTNYPDVSHHPVEEILFDILSKNEPASVDAINKAIEEHREMAKLGVALKEKLNHIISGSIVSRDDIIEVANDYYDCLTKHINSEESKLFPLIESTFTADDWDSVKTKITATEDPLFGDVVQEQFTELYKRISLSRDKEV